MLRSFICVYCKIILLDHQIRILRKYESAITSAIILARILFPRLV